MRRPFRPHQRLMYEYLMRERFAALYVEMRLGKTLVVVRKFNSMSYCDRNLIVGPYAVFNSWRKELHLEGNQELIEVSGTKKQRREILDTPGKWYITNKEGHRNFPELAEMPWTSVTLDESRFIANPKSEASKFYTENFRGAVFRTILTGTPAPEGKHEYFQQLKFLDRKMFDFKDYWHFRAKLFEPDQFGRDWAPTLEGEKYINLVLARYAFFMTRKEAGLGRIKIHQQRRITLPPAARKIYKTICREFVLEYNGTVDKTKFATGKHIWLRRLYGGSVMGKFEFTYKLDELVTLLKTELRDEKVIIASMFIDEVMFISAKLKEITGRSNHYIHGSIDNSTRDFRINEFQTGKKTDLIVHPECFKFAKDFSASKTIIFWSTPESLETRLQFEDRILSVGENHPLLYIDLVCDSTTEEDIVESLILKEGKQAMTRRIVKRMQMEASI